MYCEWPEFRRCCLCLPLRKGILIFAYINVILTILQIPVLYMVENLEDLNMMPMGKVDLDIPILYSTVLCLVEIIFNTILIFGIHKKRLSFIKFYYYFMITMLMGSMILEILCVIFARNDGPWVVYFLFYFIINLYLLFLVRSLITKLEVSNGNKFNNQLADFVDGAPVAHDSVYTEIVVPKDINTVTFKWNLERVPRKVLWWAMKQEKVPVKYLELIRAMYRKPATRILTVLQIAVLYLVNVDDLNVMPLRKVDFEMPILFSTVLCALEIFFNVLLIYGIHRKRPSLIRIYYYFTVTMILASAVVEILCVKAHNDGPWVVYFLFYFIINVYLLFLVRSLITKLEVADGNKFNNQLADFVDGAPAAHDRVYTEIVVPKDFDTV